VGRKAQHSTGKAPRACSCQYYGRAATATEAATVAAAAAKQADSKSSSRRYSSDIRCNSRSYSACSGLTGDEMSTLRGCCCFR